MDRLSEMSTYLDKVIDGTMKPNNKVGGRARARQPRSRLKRAVRSRRHSRAIMQMGVGGGGRAGWEGGAPLSRLHGVG